MATHRLLLVGVICLASVTADASSVSLQAWIGKYPYDRIEGRTYFQVPEIQSSLKRIAPAGVRRLLRQLDVAVPIERLGGYIVTSGCRPHACPEQNFVLAVHPDDRRMVLITWEGARHRTNCYSTGLQMKDVPSEIKDRFLEGHMPRERRSVKLLAANPWLDEISCVMSGPRR
jgi:hypothetical protein